MSTLYDTDQCVDLPLSDSSCRYSTSTAFYVFRPFRLESQFFKTYYEKWSFGHLLVNFNRIWVIHISLFRFYTTYNAPTIYQPKRGHSSALTWSATALGGAVATIIMILATLAEFSYIPPHPSATFPPCHSRSYGRSYILHRHHGDSWEGRTCEPPTGKTYGSRLRPGAR